jgi:DNA polymerase III subunit epsilon
VVSRAGIEVLTVEPLQALEYVVVDVETTGAAAARGHRITEIAALRVDGTGRILEEYATLVNPERPIPPFITRLTNITDAMVARAPRFAEIAPQVASLLAGRVFVAHNATFDWSFVGAELARAAGREPPPPRVLCTLRLARRLVPEVASRSLGALSEYFGIENDARHRAHGDARATVTLLQRLFERLEEQEIGSWEGIDALLRRRAARRKRTANPTWMESA